MARAVMRPSVRPQRWRRWIVGNKARDRLATGARTALAGAALAGTVLALTMLSGTMLAEAVVPTHGERRFPPIPQEAMTPEQRAVAEAIASGPRKNGAGPFDAWLRSPMLADRLQKVGEYVRFDTSLPKRLNEFAILITGRWWNTPFEWSYHYPLAIAAGVPASVLSDLSRGVEPAGMSDDETLVYRFTAELRRDRQVSDALYAQALTRFGERGVIDLLAVSGYYDVVCMTLNVAQVPAPADSTAPPLAPLR